MSSLLLVVDEAFVSRGPGVLVMPRFTVTGEPEKAPFEVTLKRPDGTSRTAQAQLEVAHMRGPAGVFAMVRLRDATVEDAPPGTEIWR